MEEERDADLPPSRLFAPAAWLVPAAEAEDDGTPVVVIAVVEMDVPSPPTPVVVTEERETPEPLVVAVFEYEVPPTSEPVVVTVAPVSWAVVRERMLRRAERESIREFMATVVMRIDWLDKTWIEDAKKPSYHASVNHLHHNFGTLHC